MLRLAFFLLYTIITFLRVIKGFYMFYATQNVILCCYFVTSKIQRLNFNCFFPYFHQNQFFSRFISKFNIRRGEKVEYIWFANFQNRIKTLLLKIFGVCWKYGWIHQIFCQTAFIINIRLNEWIKVSDMNTLVGS